MIEPNKHIAGWHRPQAVALNVPRRFYNRAERVDFTRFFDVLIAFFLLLLFSPLFIIVALLVKISSPGEIIFRQTRVGKNGEDFTLLKFRTMYAGKVDSRSLTVGKNDNRITRPGRFLRRYKLDELPQLVNVLRNEMSIVGPRPELRKYVDLYNERQRDILLLKPGITDYASIICRNEDELLGRQVDFERYYIEKLIPLKIKLNRKYMYKKNLGNYFNIIFRTVFSVVR